MFVTENKHLLEEYSVRLHQFITTCVKESIEFSLDELTDLWKPNSSALITQVHDNNNISSPAKKQRIDDHQKQPLLKPKTKQKKKATEKKSLETSAHLAAQEIIAINQFSSVFPTSSTPTHSEESSLSLKQTQQRCPPTVITPPQQTANQPQKEKQQTKQKPQKAIVRRPTKQVFNETSTASTKTILPSLSMVPSIATVNVGENEQHPNLIVDLTTLTSSPQARKNEHGSQHIYRTSTSVPTDKVPTSSTGSIVRAALTMLDDFDSDDDNTSDLGYDCPSPGLNESGIHSDFEDQEWLEAEQRESQRHGELDNLLEKIRMLEDENKSKKAIKCFSVYR